MEHKLTHGMYETLGAFVDDARLVFQNCLLYNPEGSVYVKSAVKMGAWILCREAIGKNGDQALDILEKIGLDHVRINALKGLGG